MTAHMLMVLMGGYTNSVIGIMDYISKDVGIHQTLKKEIVTWCENIISPEDIKLK